MQRDYDIDSTINRMVIDLKDYLQQHNIDNPLIIGIHTAGVWLAEKIHQKLALDESIGELNILFYRDDFSRIGLHPQTKPSKLPFSLEGRHIILVDDVLYTGRTIRAAMNELFDYGRPDSITLVVLFDREHYELPIAAQITGIKQRLAPEHYVKVTGPDPIELTIEHK